ncbi:uncharacterized protein BDZ99DRAFT_495359 [Mytilinidion resinicola]|uniref:Calponin-homology (CH) domain-containing protein n=1 Tax=Mytilinidion resinicola TaxID=574789 RepID=A0A6A6YYZ2_9PEZI|nr:uncharacterized protein BDZ99DRAFT_495359 [Mytilinidion resinicola]KAF2813719.1 hypothetical protein BDZ99DRAFT_495359 [Mytilinidion resinicola]
MYIALFCIRQMLEAQAGDVTYGICHVAGSGYEEAAHGQIHTTAAKEARNWIEDVLGERLPVGDLLDGLKDGVILCRLVNLAVPNPGIKYKKSAMPFIQMENISHFLRACEMAPLNMPVDLYESKDPAQVLQCLRAFSRVANSVNPSNFPNTIGPRHGDPGALSPTTTGGGFTSPGLNSSASIEAAMCVYYYSRNYVDGYAFLEMLRATRKRVGGFPEDKVNVLFGMVNFDKKLGGGRYGDERLSTVGQLPDELKPPRSNDAASKRLFWDTYFDATRYLLTKDGSLQVLALRQFVEKGKDLQ